MGWIEDYKAKYQPDIAGEYAAMDKDPWWKLKSALPKNLKGYADEYIAALVSGKGAGVVPPPYSPPTGQNYSGPPSKGAIPATPAAGGYPVVSQGIVPQPTPPPVPAGATTEPPAMPLQQQEPSFVDKYGAQLLPFMSQLQGQNEQAGDIQQQMGIADELRNTPMPEGRDSGRVYTAANPLEILGATIKQFKGQRDYRKETKELKKLRKQTGLSRAGFNEAIIAAMRGTQPESEKVYHGFK